MRKKIALLTSVLIISALSLAGYFYLMEPDKAVAPVYQVTNDQPNTNKQPEKEPKQSGEEQQTFNKQQYSTKDPSSLWVVVNKKNPLPSSYVPNNLSNVNGNYVRADALTQLNKLLNAASNNGTGMNILSAYRSFATQSATYNGWVARDGQAQADTYSARPGYSEHQTGLAIDLGNGACDLEACFGDTPAGKWLAKNAHTFGFIIRYPEGKQDIVGYQYEPWHLRYVGTELAAEIYRSGQTMEEFFGLDPAPTY